MQQTAFPLASSDSYNPNEYIESSSNHIAYSTLNSWPNNWGTKPYERTLIIQGPRSSGKTFLATQWAEKSGALFLKKMQELTENILREHQAFILDDFDDSWNEEKTLHHFNIIHESRKYLLITSTKLPAIKLPDLSSRIKSSHLVNIDMLDDDLMTMLIFKLFSNHSIIISNDVIRYLVKNLPREFPVIIKSVETINIYALQNKRKITVPLVKLALME